MRFNYRNFKELEPMVEERDGYGGLQEWGHGYYEYAMEELRDKLPALETQIKNPVYNQDRARAQIELIEEILGEKTQSCE